MHVESERVPMTDNQRDELRDHLSTLRAARLELEAAATVEPAESPCEDEANEWGEDTPEPETGWLDF